MSDPLKMSEMSKFKPEKCILEVCRRCYNNSNNIAYAAPMRLSSETEENHMKKLSLVLALALTLCMLCSSALAETHLNVAWWGNQTRNERTQQVLDLYTQETGTTFDVTMNSFGDYWTTMATASAGGQLPDVMQHSTAYIQQYVDNGLLLDLTPYMESGALDVSNIGESVIDLGRMSGGVYGLCVGTNSMACLYNKTILDNAGIEIHDLMTMDEFMALCKEIYEKTGYKTDLGFGTESYLNYVMRGLGKSLFADGQLGITVEDAEYFFGLYEQGTKEGWLLGGDVFASLVAGSVEQNPMVYGSSPDTMSWCAFNWSNQLVAMQAAAPEGVELALTTQPSPDPVKSGFVACRMYFSVSAKTAEPDASIAFLNYFVNSVEANKIMLGERGIPVSSVVGDAIAGDLDPLTQQVVAFVNNVIVPNSSATPAADPDGASEVYATCRELVEQISYGAISAADAAQQFVETASEILAR